MTAKIKSQRKISTLFTRVLTNTVKALILLAFVKYKLFIKCTWLSSGGKKFFLGTFSTRRHLVAFRKATYVHASTFLNVRCGKNCAYSKHNFFDRYDKEQSANVSTEKTFLPPGLIIA